MQNDVKEIQSEQSRLRVALEFAGLFVLMKRGGRSLDGSEEDNHRYPDGWVETDDESASKHFDNLDVPPILATLACIEELCTVLNENVYLVCYGRDGQRVKSWLDYRNMWSLGLRKENVIQCARRSEIGKFIDAKGINVFLSSNTASLVAASHYFSNANPIASSPSSPSSSPSSSSSRKLLLGLFRTAGSNSTLPDTQGLELPVIRPMYSIFSGNSIQTDGYTTSRSDGLLKDQWGNAMKMIAEAGCQGLRLRPFDNKTIEWMRLQVDNQHASGQSRISQYSAESTPVEKKHCCDEKNHGMCEVDEDPSGKPVTMWRVIQATFIAEEKTAYSSPDGDEANLFDNSTGLVYDSDRAWTWSELFSQLWHPDNTVAIRTVLGCRDERKADSIEASDDEAGK